jgi:hypothetical protein
LGLVYVHTVASGKNAVVSRFTSALSGCGDMTVDDFDDGFGNGAGVGGNDEIVNLTAD